MAGECLDSKEISNEARKIMKEEIIQYINNELKYEVPQDIPFQKGYYHALKKLKKKMELM